MITILKNNTLNVKISSLGAELISVMDNQLHEFIVQPSKQWIGQAKNLFPNVGILKDGYTTIHGERFELPQHGFAKDCIFTIVGNLENKVRFRLTSDNAIKKLYPYDFVLDIIFELKDNTLVQTYEVTNLDKSDMFFGLGSHTGFSVGLNKLEHYLQFFEDDDLQELDRPNMEFLSGEINTIKLNKNRYDLDSPFIAAREAGDDAHIICMLKNKSIVLHDEEHKVKIQFEDFKYVTIWRLPGKPRFVCVEPWCALPDSNNTNHIFEEKIGNLSLKSGKIKKIKQSFTFT
jgi:galactose mutarotase-like enzyme